MFNDVRSVPETKGFFMPALHAVQKMLADHTRPIRSAVDDMFACVVEMDALQSASSFGAHAPCPVTR